MRRSRRVPTLTALAVLAAALVLAACGSSSSSSSGGGSTKLSLVAYSTPKEAYAAIIPAFQKTAAGRGVTLDQSYGASGAQSRAGASGLAAGDALNTVTQGKGDVLISYENDGIAAQQKSQSVDYVIPKQTILIENPAAVLEKSKHLQQAKAFLAFLTTPQAQRIYASKGYRPVIPSLVDAKKYPTPPVLFTIKDFGGWTAVTPQFFDASAGLVTKIEQA